MNSQVWSTYHLCDVQWLWPASVDRVWCETQSHQQAVLLGTESSLRLLPWTAKLFRLSDNYSVNYHKPMKHLLAWPVYNLSTQGAQWFRTFQPGGRSINDGVDTYWARCLRQLTHNSAVVTQSTCPFKRLVVKQNIYIVPCVASSTPSA